MPERKKNHIINRHGVTLGCFALIVALILTLTQQLTKNTIAANEKAQQEKALTEVLGERWQGYQLQQSPTELIDETTNNTRSIYTVSKNRQIVALIISAVAKDGYSGNIDLLVGITVDGTITGVRVTGHSETPGLGDAIEIRKSMWIKNFDGKNLTSPVESKWTVVKQGGDFDQFTGATITPRAVVIEVKNTLQFFHSLDANLKASLLNP